MASALTPLFRAGNAVGVSLYRRSHGRIGGGAKGLPVLLLTVAGRSTGQLHTVSVVYITHDDGLVVMGSGGGSKQEPQWFRNVRAADHVTVQIGDDVHDMSSRVLSGDEYDTVWHDVVLAQAPFFQKYEDKSGRTIPLALLRR